MGTQRLAKSDRLVVLTLQPLPQFSPGPCIKTKGDCVPVHMAPALSSHVQLDEKGFEKMATGTVKKLVKDRGFGFIQPADGGDELFFHSTSLEPGGFDLLLEDQSLEYDVQPDPRNASRNRAVNVRSVS